MNIFRKITVTALSAAILTSVCACSQSAGFDSTDDNGSRSGFGEPSAVDIDPNAETGNIKWLVYEDLVTEMADMVTLFEVRYGGTVTQEICASGSAYFEKLSTLIAGGDSPDIVRYEWRSFPHGMSYNMYTPIDSYIDFDSELWVGVKEVAEQFAYNGKHYYAPNSLATNYALNYNNLVLEANGIGDPMDLLEQNRWTWSAFEEMLKQWCSMDPSHIGYNGVGGMSFVLTTGTKTIDIQNGQIINNLQNEKVQDCMSWLEKMRKEGLLGANADQVALGATNGYMPPETAFEKGDLLFLGMDPTWAYGAAKESLDKKGIPNDIKFVPFPRYEGSDTYYHGGSTAGFMIPSGAKNIKGALDWIVLNRTVETDPDEAASAKEKALEDTVDYLPYCTNMKCGDTENGDFRNRHIYTDEEIEAGLLVCPVCGADREERYKVVWTEEQYDLWQELKSDEGRFTLLFDNVYGFSDDISNMFIGPNSFLDGPVFDDESYTTLVNGKLQAVEAYLQPYRDRMTSGGGNSTDTAAK
ncbi:MAG: extracellular solute-binding protein [Oscillospiraceae bacterium]|nr:extracellular solute-binding protein [Oscillospiraceae bacterium]